MGEVDGDGDEGTCAVVQKSSSIFFITDETHLLQLLSTSTNPGCLYSMIEGIVSSSFCLTNLLMTWNKEAGSLTMALSGC